MKTMTRGMRSAFFGGIVLTAGVFGGCAPRYYYLQPAGAPLSPENIITLTRDGASDTEIARMIDESGTVIFLRTDDIIRLHENGVSNAVIDHLITVKEWTLLASSGRVSRTDMPEWRQEARPKREFMRFGALVPVSVY